MTGMPMLRSVHNKQSMLLIHLCRSQYHVPITRESQSQTGGGLVAACSNNTTLFNKWENRIDIDAAIASYVMHCTVFCECCVREEAVFACLCY